jgi:DNA (cytosine-5)-methyltransferase 1
VNSPRGRQLSHVQLFAGIGSFSLAGDRVGVRTVGHCEIDPHARAVLARHWPDVPQHDDVATVKHDTFELPDVVSFGSPCQDLSVAGKRAGLAGERSGLFMEAVRYIREVQVASGGRSPAFAVWENVPGAFSSNGGRDFAAVLESLVGGEVGVPTTGWSNAGVAFGPDGSAEWRTLDSQYFGVAQRRRRVFLVYRPGGECAGEVLLEPDGVQRDPPQSRTPGQGITGSLTGGPSSSSAGNVDDNRAQAGFVIPVLNDQGGGIMNVTYGQTATLRAAEHGHQPKVAVPVAYAATDSRTGAFEERDTAEPLTTSADRTRAAPIITFKVRGGKEGGGKGYLGSEDKALTISTVQEQYLAQPIAFALRGREDGAVPEVHEDGQTTGTVREAEGGSSRDYVAFAENSRAELRLEGGDGQRTGTLNTGGGKPGQGIPTIATPYAVRRLTPRECERLQALPDDWTAGAADTHRYRMLGNTTTVSVAEWIMRRITLTSEEAS